MNPITNNIISYFKLFNLYRGIFLFKKLFKESFNLLIKNHSSSPLTINMLITDKCNFSCKMCFYRNCQYIQDNKKEELDTKCIQKFMFKIKIYHPIIHIGGGEPFMRNDLLNIISTIKENQLKCLITTNGFLMDEDIIKRLIELKIDVLIFSLYGPEIIHDEITGLKGAFKRSMTNLESVLKKRKKATKVLVSTLPLPENIDVLKGLVKDLWSLGIDGIKIEQLNFLTNDEYNYSIINNKERYFNLSPATFISNGYFNQKFITDLINLYKDIRQDYRDFVYIKPYLNEVRLINWYSALPHRYYKCIFITHSLFINYNGDIIPCQFFIDCVLGNIKKDSLESIWLSQNYQKLRKTISTLRPVACMRCCKN